MFEVVRALINPNILPQDQATRNEWKKQLKKQSISKLLIFPDGSSWRLEGSLSDLINVQRQLASLCVQLAQHGYYSFSGTAVQEEPQYDDIANATFQGAVTSDEYDYIPAGTTDDQDSTSPSKPEAQYDGVVESKLYDPADEELSLGRAKGNSPNLARDQQKPPPIPKRPMIQEKPPTISTKAFNTQKAIKLRHRQS